MYTEKLEDDDDLFTVEQFLKDCRAGDLIDYDGFGHPVKDGLVNEKIEIYPSRRNLIPKDATHIVWYNR